MRIMYYCTGDGERRSYEDYINFGFIAAGQQGTGKTVSAFNTENQKYILNKLIEKFRISDEHDIPITNNEDKEMKGKIERYKNLLLNTRNLILHGAPGTGKTHLAKEIAKEMGADWEMVQFHPSYDYTDFVEGLRPVNAADGNSIGFERKDGVFKTFCARALKSFLDSKKSVETLQEEKSIEEKKESLELESLDDEFERLYNEIFVEIKNGKKQVGVENYSSDVRINSKGSIGFGGDARSENKDNMKLLYKYFCNENCWNDAYNNDRVGYWHPLISRLSNGKTKTIDYKFYQSMLLELNSHRKERKLAINVLTSKKEETNANKPFIFIIDEINRGEMSKIFGELFFSIDPGYRGEKGKICTQYQNLIAAGDAFADGFFVPENIYIIGTMNDIDRSVESMDFAFRRRFAFCEIAANENLGMLDKLDDSIHEEAKARLLNLNEAISNIEGLSSAYHIGGAYFLKLKELENDFDLLWNYHLKGLLREYLRGMEDSENLLALLKSAYENHGSDSESAERN